MEGKNEKKEMTRGEAIRKFEAARRRKREYVMELEKKMKEEYKKRTNQEATFFEVW